MSAVDELLAMMLADDPFVDDGRDDHAELRLAAANERFAAQRQTVRALDLRAGDLGLDAIKDRAELVPLLFAHSVYKSYPESFVAQGRWKNMSAWLDTVSTGDITVVDVSDCADVDDWLARLDQAGFHPIVSSGTSGKNSFLVLDDADVEFVRQVSPNTLGYPYRLPRGRGYPVTLLAPGKVRMRYAWARDSYAEEFGRPDARFSLSEEPVRIADTLRQSAIRRKMADGTATPSEIAAFEDEVRQRGEVLVAQVDALAATVLANRHEPQIVLGPWGLAWRLMEAGRAAGVAENALHPDSVVSIAGGLKGVSLPPDYEAQLAAWLGPVHRPRLYSMSEQSIIAPMCEAGVYHWPKALELFILDESGEHLVPIDEQGTATGRVGAYDPVWSGRWGGIVTGDKVTAHYRRCECGRPGPLIDDTIVRYSELSAGGDDKLTCGGTIEDYIRGIAGS